MSSRVQNHRILCSGSLNISHSFWHTNNVEKFHFCCFASSKRLFLSLSPSSPLIPHTHHAVSLFHTPSLCHPVSLHTHTHKLMLKHPSECRFSVAGCLFLSIFGATTLKEFTVLAFKTPPHEGLHADTRAQ